MTFNSLKFLQGRSYRVENLTRQRHDRDQTENQQNAATVCRILSCHCHVAVVFSFQHSPISLAEIWVIYIFGWLDLLQILRILAAFSFAVPWLLLTFNLLGHVSSQVRILVRVYVCVGKCKFCQFSCDCPTYREKEGWPVDKELKAICLQNRWFGKVKDGFFSSAWAGKETDWKPQEKHPMQNMGTACGDLQYVSFAPITRLVHALGFRRMKVHLSGKKKIVKLHSSRTCIKMHFRKAQRRDRIIFCDCTDLHIEWISRYERWLGLTAFVWSPYVFYCLNSLLGNGNNEYGCYCNSPLL